jgi:hypothetical protein
MKQDPDWRSFNTNHGMGHRMFTDNQNAEVTECIRNDFIKLHYLFANDDFVDFIIECSLQHNRDTEEIEPEFRYSDG